MHPAFKVAANRLAFLYVNVLESIQSYDGWVFAVLRSKIVAASIPGYVSGWCGYGFESHLQPFFADIPELIKDYDVLF